MDFRIQKSILEGTVSVPGSKSHTVRAVAIASLADSASIIHCPLISADTCSALSAFSALGAKIESGDSWRIKGISAESGLEPACVDVGNSGTTLYIAMACAALFGRTVRFTGDQQICRRPASALLQALDELGADVATDLGNGCAPLTVRGPLRGGEIRLDCSKTSQYLSALLIACPLAAGNTDIVALDLVERPYVEMTLSWLQSQGIRVINMGCKRFHIPGRQHYTGFERAIPADFSSATFFMCAGALAGKEVVLQGLDPADPQGDKAVVQMLSDMGADIHWSDSDLIIRKSELHGCELDLGDTPDALPALAVCACFAEGTTIIKNVSQARLKETDRIQVMADELGKMGADITQTPDGIIIRGGRLHSAEVEGHGDHRIIMALAVAGLALNGDTVVKQAEAVDVTFPSFAALIKSIGGAISVE